MLSKEELFPFWFGKNTCVPLRHLQRLGAGICPNCQKVKETTGNARETARRWRGFWAFGAVSGDLSQKGRKKR
jgi:hypothetical protein